MKKFVLFVACIPAFAQIPANWNQKFWQFNLTPSNAYVYNSGCVNLSGTPCSQGVGSGGIAGTLTHAVAGDVWSNAWAFDGNVYACVDDNSGANYTAVASGQIGNGGGHNLSIMKLAGNPFDGSLAITDANTMTDYGAASTANTNGWSDGRNWKCPAGGMKSITYLGTHYMVEWVMRQNNSSPYDETDTSLISTTDNWAHVSNAYGVTNSATGAAPTSPNALITASGKTAPSFVDFGLQDGACPVGVLEDCNNYLYGTAVGSWQAASTIYSWRFPISDVANPANLSTDLQWFNSAHAGCSTTAVGFPNCWDVIGNATAIYTAGSAILSMVPMTYISSSGKYIMMHDYYPAGGATTNSTSWPVLECNSVVGPCSLNMQNFSWTGTTPPGCYLPQVDSKHSDFASRALAITYACDYDTADNSPLGTVYTLYYNHAYLPPPRRPLQISSLNNDRALPANGLVLLYNFIRDYTNSTITDYSGGGNNIASLPLGLAWGNNGLAFAGGTGTGFLNGPFSRAFSAVTWGALYESTGISPNGYDRVIDSDGATNGFWMGRNVKNANAFLCGFKQTSGNPGGLYTANDNVSHLILCGYNGTSQNLFISGTQTALSGAAPGAPPSGAANLGIGADPSSNLSILTGYEWIVPLWSRQLSATEQNRTYKAISDASVWAGVAP